MHFAGFDLGRNVDATRTNRQPRSIPDVSNVLPFTPRAHRARRSRRRPRREDVVTYQVRVEVTETSISLWRELELASDLFLDDVHAVLQVAFGWADSHLHRFASGPSYYSRRAEYYLMPFEVDEGEDGVPESQVRLDEVLTERGDTLFYCYDFGDDWQHVITLKEVRPRDAAQTRARCIDGEGPDPTEDCGGVPSYELLVAVNDPQHADHREALREYARVFGEDADPTVFAPSEFDVDAINAELTRLALDKPVADLPTRLQELLESVRLAPARRELRLLINDAELDKPISVGLDDATRFVRRYTWLLDRVGSEGITLTSAGYLPPAHVEAAVADLGIDEEWIGKGNREVQTAPVLELRESAQRAGLLRKRKGRLLRTARGRDLAKDPVALWFYLAERVPPNTRAESRMHAGLLLLIAIAAGFTDNVNTVVAGYLGALGWANADRRPPSPLDAALAAEETEAVLRTLGAFEQAPGAPWRRQPSADAVAFARAALRSS